MILDPRKPELGQMARNAEESVAPHLWRGVRLAMPMVEGSGGPRDYSGNGNHGTLNGDPQWIGTPWGSGLRFGGTGDYVSFSPTVQDYKGSEPFAFGVTFRTTADGFDNYVVGTELSDGWYIRIDHTFAGGDVILVKIDDGSNDAFAAGSTKLNDGEWHQVWIVLTPEPRLLGYVDGVAEVDIDASGVGDMLDGLQLGGTPAGGGDKRFDGDIVSAIGYDRALSGGEVQRFEADRFALYRPRRTAVPVLAGATAGTAEPEPEPSRALFFGAGV